MSGEDIPNIDTERYGKNMSDSYVINEKREMYTKLLLNNMMSETKNNKVLSIKLKNYESDLINLRETLLIRLIALSEIVNQNRFKRNSVAICNGLSKAICR